MKILKIIGIGIVLIGLIAIAIFYLKSQGDKYNENLTRVMSQINLGDSSEKVKSLFENTKDEGFDYFPKGNNLMILTSPSEFGATNWRLLVEFKDSKVISVKVRSEDSDENKPKEAPADFE
jgi:hypothetical protein